MVYSSLCIRSSAPAEVSRSWALSLLVRDSLLHQAKCKNLFHFVSWHLHAALHFQFSPVFSPTVCLCPSFFFCYPSHKASMVKAWCLCIVTGELEWAAEVRYWNGNVTSFPRQYPCEKPALAAFCHPPPCTESRHTVLCCCWPGFQFFTPIAGQQDPEKNLPFLWLIWSFTESDVMVAKDW